MKSKVCDNMNFSAQLSKFSSGDLVGCLSFIDVNSFILSAASFRPKRKFIYSYHWLTDGVFCKLNFLLCLGNWVPKAPKHFKPHDVCDQRKILISVSKTQSKDQINN